MFWGWGSQKMPDDQAKSPKALPKATAPKKRRNRPILSIRARLIVVALLAIAPLMVERVRGLERARVERAAVARSQVVDLARSGIAAQREVVDSTRALLRAAARVYTKMRFDAPECNQILSDLSSNVPWIRMLAIVGNNGQVRCGSDPSVIGLNIADRPYFQNALHSRDFALSDYLIRRVSGIPGLMATFPVMKEGGAVPTSVVVASLDLRWVGELAASAAQGAGTEVFVVDGGGTVLAASAEEEQLVGKNFAGHELTKELLAKDEGTTTTKDFDGTSRILGFVRLPWTKARLAVGVDESVVHSGIDREISIAYVQLGVFGILVLLAAWFGGERLILRPIRSLARTATRFGRGDLQARAADEPWMAEFEPLAAAFDDMARKLAAREEELKIANQHLDELASLDGLTGLANRRGFDRELDHAWRHADEWREPLALIMIDTDHFKLFNDRYGHVQGDACLRVVGETLSLVALGTALIVARYGGEEFALLLPGLDIEHAVALAEEARRSIEELLMTHADAPCGIVTISIGVESRVPELGQSAACLVEAADRALYDAKRRGRNTVVAHSPLLLSSAS
jgi:diguanylate cyclase (GGDEF)-like protein